MAQALSGAARRAPEHQRWLYPLALVALCLFTYLPGALRLPAVDRTEVIWADSTRAMVEKSDWLNPNWRGTVHQFRPIGTYWVQGFVSKLAGSDLARDIRVYRIPGLIAVVLSVLALFWLSAPLVGLNTALTAAGLFAVAPLTVLLSQLAIADGLALLPATIALLALVRIYVAEDDASTWRLALLFWAAVGFGMLVNALHTPILVGVTLIGLYLFDREFSWLKRLHIWAGLPIALLIAAPWIAVRVLQDGMPFSGMDWGKFLAALGGAQDMKLRAFPGTFLLAALLGFLPGTALLAPAVIRLWGERDQKLARCLIAWMAGYILYLELLSSKPGTYTVQVMFPAMALAVALLVARVSGGLPAGEPDAPPKWHAIPWPPLAALFALTLFTLPYAAMREAPPWGLAPFAIAVAALFFWSAKRGREGALGDWALNGVAALALFGVSLTAVVMPSIDRIWPARQITRALEGCTAGPLAVTGFREPSAYFVLDSNESVLEPDALRQALVDGKAAYVAAEVRDEKARVLSRMQYRRMRPIACVEAYNTMRGCPLYFTIQSTSAPDGCTALETFPCSSDFQTRAQAARERKGCE